MEDRGPRYSANGGVDWGEALDAAEINLAVEEAASPGQHVAGMNSGVWTELDSVSQYF